MLRCWCGHFEDSHDRIPGTERRGRCLSHGNGMPCCTCTRFLTANDLAVSVDAAASADEPIGYHLVEPPRGVFGEVSKIEEELAEFKDALTQRCSLMALLELADLIGAIEGWLDRYHPSIALSDLLAMASITKRAFRAGHRVPKEAP